MRISHSAREKYEECPMMYKLHYIDKIRSTKESSALKFGGALDEALNHLLMNRQDTKGTKDVFLREWAKQKHNYNVDFFKSDLDESLLTQDEIAFCETAKNPTHEKTWLSLNYKGLAMIDSYIRDILPKIIEVHSIQDKIELQGHDEEGNPTGACITGLLDVIATVETPELGQVKAVIDNKTSSSNYAKNCVQKKEQTALYSMEKDIPYAGFAVMLKKPPFKTQFIVDKVPTALQEQTLQNFVNVVDSIEKGDFPMKEKKHQCMFIYGKPCVYIDLCWNDSMNNLIVKGEENG